MSLYSLVKINHSAPNFSLLGITLEKTENKLAIKNQTPNSTPNSSEVLTENQKEEITPKSQILQYNLADFGGKWLVLHFYSGDFVGTSAQNLREFEKTWSELEKNNIQLLGISVDSPSSHLAFAKELSLSFPLLSDTGDHQTCKDYNIYCEKSGNNWQATFVINPVGILEFYQVMSPQIDTNPSTILEIIKKLQNHS